MTQTSEPRKDFWCVVVLDDSGDEWVIRRSFDVAAKDVLPEFAGEDNGLDRAWSKNKPAGVYRLQLRPWGDVDALSGEYDHGVDVTDVQQLFELGPPP